MVSSPAALSGCSSASACRLAAHAARAFVVRAPTPGPGPSTGPEPPQRLGQFGGGVRRAVGAQHVEAEGVAAHEHHDVALAGGPGPGVGVGRAGGVLPVAGDARGGEQVLVLLHGHRHALAGGRGQRAGVDAVLVVERAEDQPGGPGGLVLLGGVVARGEEEEEVRVEGDAVPAAEVAGLPEVVEPAVGVRRGGVVLQGGLQDRARPAHQLVDGLPGPCHLLAVEQRGAPLEELGGAVLQRGHGDAGQAVLGVERADGAGGGVAHGCPRGSEGRVRAGPAAQSSRVSDRTDAAARCSGATRPNSWRARVGEPTTPGRSL